MKGLLENQQKRLYQCMRPHNHLRVTSGLLHATIRLISVVKSGHLMDYSGLGKHSLHLDAVFSISVHKQICFLFDTDPDCRTPASAVIIPLFLAISMFKQNSFWCQIRTSTFETQLTKLIALIVQEAHESKFITSCIKG